MLKRCKGIALVLICLLLLWGRSISQQDSILLFVSDNDTYYSEYIVMYEALIASGYFVDVRNGGSAAATMYTIGGDITAQADMLAGSDYTAFTSQFQTMFGSTWNATLNAVPASIAVNDSIQNVPNMTPYKGLVVVGGTGAVDFRVDGTYASQGSLSATQVQSAAEKLNTLAVEALLQGKPVMGQCHGASIPAYWRIPGTAPAGFDGLGLSLLSGSIATGFPEPATGPGLSNLNITFRPDDKVVVGNPDSLMHNGSAYFRIITTRDWFPQTVAHAAKTLTNIIESYPDPGLLTAPVSLLIIHGGAVNVANCGAGNQSNDVPCNYGSDPANLPADYTDLVTLYTSDQFSDSFDFVVSDVNLFATTPFDLNDELEILNYLSGFDVVFFYKHWSSQVTEALQNAIVDFADQGGGVVSIHHGLYNQNQGVIGKSILVDSLFQAHSPSGTWSANRTTYNIFQVNYGHFVSTNGIINDGVSSAPVAWTMPPLSGSNRSLSLYPRFQLFDEIYNNMQFVAGTNFGDGINEVNPIFSNNQTPSAQTHVHGFVKLFDGNGDGNVGRVVFGSPGETIANYEHPHPYAQFLRNAVYWARGNGLCTPNTTTWMVESGDWDTNINWSGNAVPDECSDVVIPDQVSEAIVTTPNSVDINIHLLEVGLNVVFSVPLGTTLSILTK